jgi:hypothetical protein
VNEKLQINPERKTMKPEDDRRKTNARKPYKCLDGPWIGEVLWLCSPFTAWFSVQGEEGRYAHGRWQAGAPAA